MPTQPSFLVFFSICGTANFASFISIVRIPSKRRRYPYLCRLIELAEEVVERLHELADAEGRRQRSEPADVGEQDTHYRGMSKVQLTLGFS